MDDIITAYGHHSVGLTRRVIPPLGEARRDREILQGLAERLGFGSALDGEPLQWAQLLIKPLSVHGLNVDELTRRSIKNPVQQAVPFSNRRFLPSSGKYESLSTHRI